MDREVPARTDAAQGHREYSLLHRGREVIMDRLIDSLLALSPKARGEIDCGGLDHVWIRYGNFWTGLFPTDSGHVNVGLEPDAVPTDLDARIRGALERLAVAAR
jgi:hypothetical protein